MKNLADFLQTASQYFDAKHTIRMAFPEFSSEINYNSLTKQEKNLLQQMLKDPSFEVEMFEFFLKHEPSIALRHLAMYYLDGEIIEDKARYQSNLDTLLDDIREILGEAKLDQILQSTTLKARKFYSIKRAVKEVYGAESDKELPKWYWEP